MLKSHKIKSNVRYTFYRLEFLTLCQNEIHLSMNKNRTHNMTSTRIIYTIPAIVALITIFSIFVLVLSSVAISRCNVQLCVYMSYIYIYQGCKPAKRVRSSSHWLRAVRTPEIRCMHVWCMLELFVNSTEQLLQLKIQVPVGSNPFVALIYIGLCINMVLWVIMIRLGAGLRPSTASLKTNINK